MIAPPSIAELGSSVGPAAQYVASQICRPGWLELLAVVSLVLVAAALAGCCGCVAGLALGLSLNPHGAETALQAGAGPCVSWTLPRRAACGGWRGTATSEAATLTRGRDGEQHGSRACSWAA